MDNPDPGELRFLLDQEFVGPPRPDMKPFPIVICGVGDVSVALRLAELMMVADAQVVMFKGEDFPSRSIVLTEREHVFEEGGKSIAKLIASLDRESDIRQIPKESNLLSQVSPYFPYGKSAGRMLSIAAKRKKGSKGR